MPQIRTSEPIAKVDTAWLRMEQPTNLMMITGVVTLAGPVEYERLLDTIRTRWLAFKRFRQKAVDRPTGAHWVTDEDFEIHAHVRRVALPGKADQAELEEFVSDLASTALDPSRPLWQFHYIENYAGGPVIVQRIHHSYADGIALVQVFLSLTDTAPEPPPAALDPAEWRKTQVEQSSVFRRLVEPAKNGFGLARHWTRKVTEEGLRVLADPDRAAHFAGEASGLARELVHSVSLPDDPKTIFKGRLGVRKRVAWAEPLPLDEVKALSKALGCTVNDLLIATVTGSLNSYLLDRGERPSAGTEIRATVPVNLRPLEHARELGNHFGLVFLSLPVGESNPLKRVRFVSERMNELKSGRQATVAFGLLAALGMGPSALQKPALQLLSDKATTVLTNVPGPQQPLYFAGERVKDMMFWVPQNGSIGMGISIFSYDGQVFFGVITDRKLVPEPHQIIDRFRPEFEKLVYLSLLLPVDRPEAPLLAEALVRD
ncbi:MAG: wax ester/triacylglycerol synthase family O-acyltransferase [Xanthomonadales bacterium]|nr:wax ester/triacylglycerol synthase family O-acyltransferase [Xanthomonadales bacterium]